MVNTVALGDSTPKSLARKNIYPSKGDVSGPRPAGSLAEWLLEYKRALRVLIAHSIDDRELEDQSMASRLLIIKVGLVRRSTPFSMSYLHMLSFFPTVSAAVPAMSLSLSLTVDTASATFNLIVLPGPVSSFGLSSRSCLCNEVWTQAPAILCLYLVLAD